MQFMTIEEFAEARSLGINTVKRLVERGQVDWMDHAPSGSKKRLIRIRADTQIYRDSKRPKTAAPVDMPYDPSEFEETV